MTRTNPPPQYPPQTDQHRSSSTVQPDIITATDPPSSVFNPTAATTTANKPLVPLTLSPPPSPLLPLTPLLLLTLTAGLSTTLPASLLPSLTTHFHTIADLSLYTSTTPLALAATTFLWARAYTFLPLRRVFLCAVALFVLGSALSAGAWRSGVLVAGRMVVGVGMGGLGGGVVLVVGRVVVLERRPVWFGVVGGVQSVGLVGGPLVGGALVDGLGGEVGWRVAFGMVAVAGAVGGGLVWWMGFGAEVVGGGAEGERDGRGERGAVEDREEVEGRAEESNRWRAVLKLLDLPSALTITPGITCLLLTLQWGGTSHAWSSPLIIALLTTSLLCLAVFASLQHRAGPSATIPPHVILQRSVLGCAWYQVCSDAALAVVELYVAIYLQTVRGFSATKAGALGLPMIIGLMLTSLAAGWGTTKIGYYAPFMLAAACLAPVPSGILTTLALNESAVLKPLVCLGLLGAALGLGINGPFAACQCVLEQRDVAVGNAIMTFAGGLGSSVAVTGATAVFRRSLEGHLDGIEGLDVGALARMGLKDLRERVGGEELGRVLLGYQGAVVSTLYLPMALALAAIVGAAMVEWKSVKQKRD